MEFYIKNYDILTNTERDLLHYILDNEELVQKLTAAKLADRCGVSKTVVINMCQKLGFDGYNELKYYLKNTILKMKKQTINQQCFCVELGLQQKT